MDWFKPKDATFSRGKRCWDGGVFVVTRPRGFRRSRRPKKEKQTGGWGAQKREKRNTLNTLPLPCVHLSRTVTKEACCSMMAGERSGGRWGGCVEGGGLRGGVYLSLGEQDVGDDVREAAAEHQHHAVLAVGDTGHLQRGGALDLETCFEMG